MRRCFWREAIKIRTSCRAAQTLPPELSSRIFCRHWRAARKPTLGRLLCNGPTTGGDKQVGVLCVFNQNRQHWTPPKWLGDSAVFPSAGSLPTIWRLILWTYGGRVAMRNGPWIWLEVEMLERVEWEKCIWGRYDDGIAPKRNKQYVNI